MLASPIRRPNNHQAPRQPHWARVAAQVLSLETNGTIRTAGTTGTVIEGRRSTGKFFPTIPDDSKGLKHHKEKNGFRPESGVEDPEPVAVKGPTEPGWCLQSLVTKIGIEKCPHWIFDSSLATEARW